MSDVRTTRTLFSAPPHEHRRVLVLGAGIAGLVAAGELRAHGYDVTVLEARQRVGGRVHTMRLPGSELAAEMGAMRIPHDHRRTVALCGELGLTLLPFASGSVGTRESISRSGVDARSSGLAGWERSRDVWSRWERTVEDVRRDWFRLSRRQFIDRWDRLSIRGFLRSRGWSEQAIEEYGIVTFTESTLGTSVLQEFRETFSSAYETAYRIDGGMDLLPRGLADRLRDCVLLGHEVEQIVDGVDGIEVATRTAAGQVVFRADLVVCTLPFPVLRTVDLVGSFSPGKRRAVRQLHYDAATKVYLQLRRPTWRREVGLAGGAVSTAAPIRRTQYPALDHLGADRHLLLASYTWGQDALQWAALSENERMRLATRDLEQAHPGVSAEVEGSISHAWSADRYAMGAYALGEPGQTRDLLDDAVRPEGRIVFAGEHCSHLPAWIEGAVESAHDAVAMILPRRPAGARASWL